MIDPGKQIVRRSKRQEAADVMVLGLVCFFGGLLIIKFVVNNVEAALSLAGIAAAFGIMAALRRKNIADAEAAIAGELAEQPPVPSEEEMEVLRHLNFLQKTREEDFKQRWFESLPTNDVPTDDGASQSEGRYPPL